MGHVISQPQSVSYYLKKRNDVGLETEGSGFPKAGHTFVMALSFHTCPRSLTLSGVFQPQAYNSNEAIIITCPPESG